jgi:hypothetical protein
MHRSRQAVAIAPGRNLLGMKFSELVQLALDEGVDESTIEDCMDERQPNMAIIRCLDDIRRNQRGSQEGGVLQWSKDELDSKRSALYSIKIHCKPTHCRSCMSLVCP